jgi:hypothetical protein
MMSAVACMEKRAATCYMFAVENKVRWYLLEDSTIPIPLRLVRLSLETLF